MAISQDIAAQLLGNFATQLHRELIEEGIILQLCTPAPRVQVRKEVFWQAFLESSRKRCIPDESSGEHHLYVLWSNQLGTSVMFAQEAVW